EGEHVEGMGREPRLARRASEPLADGAELRLQDERVTRLGGVDDIRPALAAVIAVHLIDNLPQLFRRQVADDLTRALGAERRDADKQQRFDDLPRRRRGVGRGVLHRAWWGRRKMPV